MTRTVLPASVMPDVLIANGTTYLALPMAGAMVVSLMGSDGQISHGFPVGSYPRLFAHTSGILCAYKTGDDECLTVANITTGEVTRTGIPAFWNSPCCWRDDSLLCVQATPDAQIWSGVWPALPAPPSLRQGAGTGLAQWINRNLYTWDELSVTGQPVYLSDLDGTMVSQDYRGGVGVRLGNVTGVIELGMITNNPRPALAADGSLSIVYWSQDSRGATQTVLYQGVTAADLKPAPPSYPVTPLTKATLFGCFDKVTWPLWANARTQDANYPASGVYGLDANGETVRWNMFDLESQTGDRTSPCCYNGSADAILNRAAAPRDIRPTIADILSPWIYPDAGEDPADFEAKASQIIWDVRKTYPGIPIAPVWRVDTRIGANGPTLTEDQVLHCLSIASSFGLPALFFQGDRAGFVEAAVPLLEKWRNGQPCSVPIQPVPPPPQDAAALLLLKGLS